MNIVNYVLVFFTFFFILSCSSTSSVKTYQTYNQKLYKTQVKTKETFITDFKNIPKFKKLKNTIAPGFLFALSHPTDDKLKGKYRVSFSGILRLPYNIRLNVKGLTFKQLENRVLDAYAKFFQDGASSVKISLLYRHYYVEVRGHVNKTGRFLVTRKESIDKVIDRAAGIKNHKSNILYKASIKQQGQSYSISLNQYFQNNVYSNAFTWTGGDTIYISEQDESEIGAQVPIVTVLSGVNSPGRILYKDNANIFYYLSKSGGTLSALSYDESYIIRNTSTGIQDIKFDITQMDQIPVINPGDIIMLQGEKRTAVDKMFERTGQISSIILTMLLILAL